MKEKIKEWSGVLIGIAVFAAIIIGLDYISGNEDDVLYICEENFSMGRPSEMSMEINNHCRDYYLTLIENSTSERCYIPDCLSEEVDLESCIESNYERIYACI